MVDLRENLHSAVDYLHHLTIVYIDETMTTKIVFYVHASYYKSQQIRVVLLKVLEAYLDGIISKK